jgi:hypothetical protein
MGNKISAQSGSLKLKNIDELFQSLQSQLKFKSEQIEKLTESDRKRQ